MITLTSFSRRPSLMGAASVLTRRISFKSIGKVIKKYLRFIGPGLMVSVAYMDPGNYSTAVAAGSAYQYKLLFLILLSNCLAIFLQILSARLGCVTGLDLATNCRVNLPPRINILVYFMAEVAIIATDLAEVVGTAIALNILFDLPLLLGVVITIIDVLIVLMAYRPKGPLLFIRIFESFVSILVAATVVCFGIELFQVSNDETIDFKVSQVLKGFLPNEKVVDMSDREGGNGLFLSLAILGATVMPHSLYLGSGLVQSRLKDFDLKHGYFKSNSEMDHSDPQSLSIEPQVQSQGQSDSQSELHPDTQPLNSQLDDSESQPLTRDGDNELNPDSYINQYKLDETNIDGESDSDDDYRPSIHAINDIMSYTIVELVISLFTVALFVNSAILIVAGATLQDKQSKYFLTGRSDDHDDHDDDSSSDDEGSGSDDEDYENADLFTIYHLLSTHLSSTAGLVFALALLFSGQSAGIVCTLAGQMVLEGFLLWSLPPVTRRLITRALAIIPCLVVVSMTGREGLSNILNLSQVILSLLLPFVTAPLIMFTCSKEIMRVPIFNTDHDEEVDLIIDDPITVNASSRHNSFIGDSNGLTNNRGVTDVTTRYKSSEPAIRLQDLKNSHPCAGFGDDEDNDNHIQLNNSTQRSPSQGYDQRHSEIPQLKSKNVSVSEEDSMLDVGNDAGINRNSYRVKGYKDLSNGPFTSFLAILVWGFITLLNLFLIGSLILGYDVPI